MTTLDVEADQLRALESTIEELRTSLLMWKLFFFVPLWIGVYATLVTVLFRASP